jgi:large subunit ribosomal protein L32
MSVPKQRRNSSATSRRRSHLSLTLKKVNACAECGKTMTAHRACPECGSYKGKKTLLSKKADKKKQRARLKSI